jgi:hypothetical protein
MAVTAGMSGVRQWADRESRACIAFQNTITFASIAFRSLRMSRAARAETLEATPFRWIARRIITFWHVLFCTLALITPIIFFIERSKRPYLRLKSIDPKIRRGVLAAAGGLGYNSPPLQR